jgi:hypothetical protein
MRLVIPHAQIAAVGTVQIRTVLHHFALLFHILRIHSVKFCTDHQRRHEAEELSEAHPEQAMISRITAESNTEFFMAGILVLQFRKYQQENPGKKN